ncbi:MAG: NUDIX domain-containing protein [Chryseolinea sp.]
MLSAGMLMCRNVDASPEFFLIHPGGPFWAHKNDGAWSIPKGLAEGNESLLDTALREFFEETGIKPVPPYHDLGRLKTKAGKILHVWSFIGEWNQQDKILSNKIKIEYPYKSGKVIEIPEADRGEWMNLEKAMKMINPSQVPFLDRAITAENSKDPF